MIVTVIVACAACHSRFEGAGYRDVHCPSCGALAQQPGVRPCPRCELPLTPRQVSDLVIDECSSCRGLFLDDVAIERVLADDHHTRAQALLDAVARTAHQPTPPAGGRMYVKCPTCRTVMNRKLFATGSGVVVDVCKQHGTFFDAGELPAIIEFAQSGGLAIAAKKDAERAREQARRAAVAARTVTPTHPDDTTALGEVLFLLFG